MSKVKEFLRGALGNEGANGALSRLAKGATPFSLAKSLGYDGEDDDGEDDDEMEKGGRRYKANDLIKALRQGEASLARPAFELDDDPFPGLDAAIAQASAGNGTALLKSLVDGNVSAAAGVAQGLDELNLRVTTLQELALAKGHGIKRLLDRFEALGQLVIEQREEMRELRKALGAPESARAIQRPRQIQPQQGQQFQPQQPQQQPQQAMGALKKSDAMRLLNTGMAKAEAVKDMGKLKALSLLAPIVETAADGVTEDVATRLQALAS